MGVLLRRHRHPAFISFVFLIIFASVSVLPQLSTAISGVGVQVEGEARPSGWRWSTEPVVTQNQKRQGGPGSWPPSCRSKCGNCTPCKPVHVPIHPGLSVPQEYYPEAWRCKCGNKLYMP